MNQLTPASLEDSLQRMINQLGQLLKVDCCLLRPLASDSLFGVASLRDDVLFFPTFLVN